MVEKREEEAKENLLRMVQQSYAEALFAGTSGNLSTYDRDKEIMMITPSGIAYENMEKSDLILMRLNGEILDGKHKPSSEWRMHAEVYRAKSNVNAVVHTHSPYATSFAVNHEMIPIILIEMVPFLGGSIPVAEFALPGTESVGKAALNVLKDKNACLMANHGVLAIGKTLEQAHIRAIYVEDAAKIYSLAKSNGEVKEVPEKFVNIMMNRGKAV